MRKSLEDITDIYFLHVVLYGNSKSIFSSNVLERFCVPPPPPPYIYTVLVARRVYYVCERIASNQRYFRNESWTSPYTQNLHILFFCAKLSRKSSDTFFLQIDALFSPLPLPNTREREREKLSISASPPPCAKGTNISKDVTKIMAKSLFFPIFTGLHLRRNHHQTGKIFLFLRRIPNPHPPRPNSVYLYVAGYTAPFQSSKGAAAAN